MSASEREQGWTPALPDRDAVREDEREAYDSVIERQTAYGYAEFVKRFRHESVLAAFPGDRVQPYFAAMLNSPLIAGGMSDLGAIYRSAGEYDDGMSHSDREWADQVVSAELEINWVPYVHAPDGVASGIRPEAILAVIQGREEDLTDPERAKSDFIRAVCRGTMTPELYRAVESEIGARAAVELVTFSGHLIKTTRLMQAWGIPDLPKRELEEYVQAIVDGEVEVPEGPRVPSK